MTPLVNRHRPSVDVLGGEVCRRQCAWRHHHGANFSAQRVK